jgi:membrane-bound lytic murein transglycosylase D
MKRFFVFATCFLSLQIVKAHILPAAGSANKVIHRSTPLKTFGDTAFTPVPSQVVSTGMYSNSIFKHRLDSIQKDVPLDYNEYVQNYIDIYTRHRDEMGHVLGLAKYYFPIYEKIFREAGIPPEIKYLSIVESKLDPNAVSRVGATGPWQFMSTTARLYGLNMDSYVDERRDPIQASYAAAAYLKDAYQEFGDWLLAIASYNCGKSNVERAIEKAGANDFWSIRQYLPVETRGYVPAYIAIAYVMNYANKHNIVPQSWSFSANADTVWVDKFVSLGNVAKAINVDVNQLSLLNPAYRKQVVNGTGVNPRRLIIPNTEKINYSSLYNVLNNIDAPIVQHVTATQPPPIVTASISANAAIPAAEKQPDFYKVKRGETLVDIAANFGIDIHDLKVWNHLHTNKPRVGQILKLNPDATDPEGSTKGIFVTYKVKPGDTWSEITAKFDGTSVESIKSLNGLKSGRLQPGMTLKISRG